MADYINPEAMFPIQMLYPGVRGLDAVLEIKLLRQLWRQLSPIILEYGPDVIEIGINSYSLWKQGLLLSTTLLAKAWRW